MDNGTGYARQADDIAQEDELEEAGETDNNSAAKKGAESSNLTDVRVSADSSVEDGAENDIECYKTLLVHLRQINLCLQKQCDTPMGEIISLLTIQRLCDEEGQATVTGLGKKLHLSRPAVSRMIHTLKRKGYIEFHHGKKDHRYHYVTLTEEGRGVIRNEMRQIMLTFRDMSEKMGKEDMEQFLYYSRKFLSLLPG